MSGTLIDTPALRIADNFTLPIEAVTDTIGILAVKGSGKSYTFMVMAEEMARSGAPVIIVDVVGVCWGLRASADGRGEGLPIVVLGGERGDLPLDPNAGRVLAEFAAAERRSIVLDVSAFETKADQIRFVTAFVQRLYEVNREPIHVMIDEADEFIPQKPFGEETRMVRAFEVLVRRGRARGIGITMVTQRPAVLNKNVLTMVGTLVVGRIVAPQDRKAIAEWVDAHGTEEQKATLWKSLAALPTSDKWIWSPLAGIFARVRIRARETYDSSATPKLGAVRVQPQQLAPVDLDALRSRIASTIEKAQADDPKVLRAKIAELERQLVTRTPEVRIEERIVEVSRVNEQMLQDFFEAGRIFQQIIPMVSGMDVRVLNSARALREAHEKTSDTAVRAPMVAAREHGGDERASRRAEPPKSAAPARGTTTLGGGERKILTALAQYPRGRTKIQVALLTGYAHNGGGFSNYLSSLRGRGLLEGDGGCLRITPAGKRELGDYTPLPTGRALLEHWKSQLDKAPRMILEELAAVYPRTLRKDAVASRTGYDANGGGFNNALSRLRTLELISGRGEMRASEELVG